MARAILRLASLALTLLPILAFPARAGLAAEDGAREPGGVLLYQGHASLRITTREGKVIYVDPYGGAGYDAPADLILVTHAHSDHAAVHLIKEKNPGCVTITQAEALEGGEHRTFAFDFVTVEAVQATNARHSAHACVGYILTFTNGASIYISGDTSTTDQMSEFANRELDYAFFCCDGYYNMDTEEASQCAALVAARHGIPYHMMPGKLFDRESAEAFQAEGRIILADGEELAF